MLFRISHLLDLHAGVRSSLYIIYYGRILTRKIYDATAIKSVRVIAWKAIITVEAAGLRATLALTLTFNHLANELLQATTMLYGLMYLTYGSATEHNMVRDGL